ncbi:MAG TPA: D-ribose pyranase [Feifaniaceae bacterium]|nr:D-ribose pyranase [Feifaniaceae bacterium]
MKKAVLLNQPVSAAIAGMGHKDTLAIGDCGLPIPEGPVRIDLAVKKGLPAFLDVLDTVLEELCVEKVTIASEMKDVNPALYAIIRGKFAGTEIEEIPHEAFKERTKESRAVIRTGEYKPYANIILHSGVTF